MVESISKFKPHPALLGAVLGLVILGIFSPAFYFDFVNFDDDKYILTNPMVREGLSYAGIKWAFTSTYASNWHPLTWLSHMLDVQFFGLQGGKHHLTNALIHAANVFLLLVFLQQMTGALWRSALVAALFGLHPLHVESVAWIAERKDVLSAFFFLLTLLAYGRYAKARSDASGLVPPKDTTSQEHQPILPVNEMPQLHSLLWYMLAMLFFILGLLSKPMLVTLPFVLLLLDFWPLGRIDFNPAGSLAMLRLVREKIPFFALTAASCIITFFAQKQGGAVASLEHVPFGARFTNALVSYEAYLEKAFWPVKLAVLYLAPAKWPFWQVALAAAVLVIITWAVIRLARSEPYLAVGWFWYLGMLVPVIGLVQVGNQSMADRYTYLPLIGIFVMVAWGGWEVLQTSPSKRAAAVACAVSLLILTGFATSRQLQYWKNGTTLFRRCLSVTANNHIAHNNFGVALMKEGKYEEARTHFQESIRIAPTYSDALKNMGVLLTQAGEIEAAEQYLREGIRLAPHSADIYGKLALALSVQGKFENAIEYYRECLRLKPDQVEAYNNLAWILATNPKTELRDGAEAVRLAERACQLTDYKTPVLLGTLAAAYAEAGRFDEAVSTAEKARDLARAAGHQDAAQKNEELLELYRAGKPYREP